MLVPLSNSSIISTFFNRSIIFLVFFPCGAHEHIQHPFQTMKTQMQYVVLKAVKCRKYNILAARYLSSYWVKQTGICDLLCVACFACASMATTEWRTYTAMHHSYHSSFSVNKWSRNVHNRECGVFTGRTVTTLCG